MAEENRDSIQKWEGKAIAELRSTTPDQVWPLLEDFCNLHKWLPTMDTCRHVQGVYGQPGLIRYCATTLPSSSPANNADQTPTTVVKWCHEKLLSIDPVERRLSYEIAENNVGFTSYVAEWKVIEIEGGDESRGCQIEWSFTADPVEGWKLEDLSGYIGSSLEAMAKRMEEDLQAVAQ